MGDYIINDMSTNLILRFTAEGQIWAKISRMSVPPKLGEAIPGIVYINGIKYTVTSYEFTQIIPA